MKVVDVVVFACLWRPAASCGVQEYLEPAPFDRQGVGDGGIIPTLIVTLYGVLSVDRFALVLDAVILTVVLGGLTGSLEERSR